MMSTIVNVLYVQSEKLYTISDKQNKITIKVIITNKTK